MNNLIGKQFENVSSKRIQMPLRISDEFCWGLKERIEIINECKEASGKQEGYIVRNLDYKGAERCFETAWISKEVLAESFREIEENNMSKN